MTINKKNILPVFLLCLIVIGKYTHVTWKGCYKVISSLIAEVEFYEKS